MNRLLIRLMALTLCSVGAAQATPPPAAPARPEAEAEAATSPKLVVAAAHRYVVSLASATSPIAIPPLPALGDTQGYVVYTSRYPQQDRAWHRLRVGFFASRVDAQRVQDKLRTQFPQA